MRTKNRFFTSSIRRRISLAFLIITVFVLGMAATTYFQLRQIQPFSEQIIQNSSDLVQLQKLAATTAALDADLERYLVIRGIEYRESVYQDIQELSDTLALLQNPSTNSEQLDLVEIEATTTQLLVEVQNVLDAVDSDASSGIITRNIVAVYDGIEQLLLLQQELSTETLTSLQTAAQAQSQIASQVVTQSVVIGIIVVSITVFATFTTDRRLRSIITLTNTTTAIAEGDLNRVAPVESDDEIGTLAVSFNTMTSQLRETLEGLEQRIADRTRALETSTEVSRQLSTILDQEQLVREVVEQLRSAFGYYHVQIYLFDNRKQNLVMAGGTGDAGQTMLEQGHSVPKGRGLVGRAGDTNLPIVVPDVSLEEGWLPNPLLPETKAEAAIPIAAGENVLGVLDVQEKEANGLTEVDVDLLQSISNQVGSSLQNARAYQRTQQQVARETLMANINQQIQSTTDVEDALKVTVRELGRALGANTSVSLQKVYSNNGQEESA